MDQLRLEWAEPIEAHAPDEVALDRETTEAAVALMARALVAVVRAAGDAPSTREADDEQ